MGVVLSNSPQQNNISTSSTSKNSIQDDFKRPRFYNGREGPSFKTLDFNKCYETRHVKTNLWVSTIVKGSFQEAVSQGLPKLKKYMRGHNQQKKFLNDTCPILMKKILQEHMEGKIVVSMLIPYEYLHCPPATTIPDVYIEEEPKHIYYASIHKKQFYIECVAEEVFQTMGMMDKRGEKYEKGYYSVAVYDISVKQLSKVKYYEYWVYGEKMEKDYKSSRLSDDEDDDVLDKRKSNSLNMSKSSKYLDDRGGSTGSNNKATTSNSNTKTTPFLEGMMKKHMMKLEL